jgi:hypothetical protein
MCGDGVDTKIAAKTRAWRRSGVLTDLVSVPLTED